MKKILLLHASFMDYSFDNEWKENESLSPPLGLLYLASPLIKEGHEVTYVDLNVDKFAKEEFLKLLKEQEFLLITCYTGTISNVLKIIKDARKINPKLCIICGGPYCNMSEQLVAGSDLTCIGEAESYIATIIKKVTLKKPLNLPGLIYKKNGKTMRNPGIMKCKDLNDSLFPALELSKNKNYGYISGIKLNIASIISSRGCPFDCKYCTHRGRIVYRQRSVDNVIKEIKQRVAEGYEYLFFGDDNFLLSKKRALEIMDRIIEEKIRIKMIMQGRVDRADYELYKKLKKAGVIMIMFGIESVNQDVLDYYNKRTTVGQEIDAITIADKVGIITFGYLMIGAPIEKMEHFENTKNFFDKYPWDIMLNGLLYYLKGSKLWEEAHEKGLIKNNEYSVMTDKKFSNFSQKELFKIKNDLTYYFYKNPKRIIRILFKLIKNGQTGLIIDVFLTGKYKKLIEFMKAPYDLTQRK
ncbi:MAG: radical SAM protein [Candidatus Nanoarchaeia archaeon]